MKSKRNLMILAIVISISLIGVTYAFFDYYMMGANQKITAGKVNLTLNEGEDTINRGNIFPETVEKARSRTDNFITFTVSGVNTSEDEDIYYEIMLNEGDPETGMTRFDARDLVFDLVELDEDGNEITYVVDAMSYSDFNERRIWVNTVDRNTATTVNKTYKLRMWLSEDIKISDTNPNADYPSTGYENYYASVKVSVYGDFVEKSIPYNYMAKISTDTAAFWPDNINAEKANIIEVNFISLTSDEINTRVAASTINADVTDTSLGGNVKAWLETDATDTTKYILYIASDGTTYFPSNSSSMFYGFTSVTNINFRNVDTKNIVDMSDMFAACSNLVELDLIKFDTSNVTNMSQMFASCRSLNNLAISHFDTTQVTNMYNMFVSCSSLTNLDIGGWNTENVDNMSFMFCACSSLTDLDISDWNIESVTNMTAMFVSCSNLINLDLTNWNVSNVTTLSSMFAGCSNLVTIYVNYDWNTDNGASSGGMFSGCNSLVGAVPFDSSKTDITMANPTTGYFTSKIA